MLLTILFVGRSAQLLEQTVPAVCADLESFGVCDAMGSAASYTIVFSWSLEKLRSVSSGESTNEQPDILSPCK